MSEAGESSDGTDSEIMSRGDVVRIHDSQVRIESELGNISHTHDQVREELDAIQKELRFIANAVKLSAPTPWRSFDSEAPDSSKCLESVREERQQGEGPRRQTPRSGENSIDVAHFREMAPSALDAETSKDEENKDEEHAQNRMSSRERRSTRVSRKSTRSKSTFSVARSSSMSRTPSDRRGASSLRGVLAISQHWPANIGIRENFNDPNSGVQLEELAAEVLENGKLEDFGLSTLRISIGSSSGSGSVLPRAPRVMSPSSDARLALDVVSLAVLLFDLATTPYILAWDVDVRGAFLGFAFVSLLFWTSDIFLNFRLGYYKDGELEMRPMAIAKHYLQRTFALDVVVVCVEWFGMILLFIGEGEGAGAGIRMLRTAKVSKVLRVLNVLRMARVAEVFDRLADRNLLSPSGSTAIEVMKLLLFIVWLNHMICCLWYAIGRSGASDTGAHWLDLSGSNGVRLHQSTTEFQYFTAFHWSLTQMTPGSMKVEPQNTYERLFNICCLLFGLLCFSTVISLLSSRMMHVTVMKQDQTQKINQLRRFLRQHGVHPSLSMAITKQAVNQMVGTKMLTVKDIYCLTILPESRQSELYYELYKAQLTTHTFFRFWAAADLPSLQHLCLKIIQTKVLQQEDSLFHAGFKSHGAFILMRGNIQYYQCPESSRVTEPSIEQVEPGDWLSEASLWTRWSHVGATTAISQCEVLFINAEAFINTVMEQHSVRHFAMEYAENYHARLVNASPPYAPWPNDLGCPYTDRGEIVGAMSDRMRAVIGMLAIDFVSKKKWFWSRNFVQKLQEEVRSGSSTFLPPLSGEILRVVENTAVFITRQSDDRILAQLGFVRGREIDPRCKLPSTDVQQGELPATAWQRLMGGELEFLAGKCALERAESTLEVVDSDAYGVRTQHLRIIHYAELVDEDLDMPPHMALAKATANSPDGFFSPPYYEVIFDRSGGACYSWLTRSELDHLSNQSKDVDAWLRGVMSADDTAVTAVGSVQGEDGCDSASVTSDPERVYGI